jgi:hypothetical protein
MVLMVMFDAYIAAIQRYSGMNVLSMATEVHGSRTNISILYDGRTGENAVNRSTSIANLYKKLNDQNDLTYTIIKQTVNTLSTFSNRLQDFLRLFAERTRQQTLETLKSVIVDRNLLQMLLTEQQIVLFASTLNELVDRLGTVPSDAEAVSDLSNGSLLKVIDDAASLTPNLRAAFYGVMSQAGFSRSEAASDRVLSVGLPIEFSKRLKQYISASNSKKTPAQRKQNDIVNVCVYKIDVHNSSIVFKPQRFMFELSRFVVRNDLRYLQLPDRPTMDDIIRSIPTRDYSPLRNTVYDPLSYYKLDKSTKTYASETFFDQSYDFLTDAQKHDILKNHIVSYMLEVYVRIMTGMTVGDHHFDLIEQPKLYDGQIAKMLLDRLSLYLTDDASSTFDVSQKQYAAASSGVSTISYASNVVTNMSDPVALSNRLLFPKQFDRIFNVIIDPDAFEIDVAQTCATKQGTQALEQAVAGNDVTVSIDLTNVANYSYAERKRNGGDLRMEKYFVTIETYGEDQ